ncbi:hypothetical protein AMTRI_Chr11g157360 [Amborella trichopoda]
MEQRLTSLLLNSKTPANLKKTHALVIVHGHSSLLLWNAIIRAYAHNKLITDAFMVYRHMTQVPSLKPNSLSLTFLLNSCRNPSFLGHGRAIHSCILKTQFKPNLFTLNIMLNMYLKCGDMRSATKVFDAMPQRNAVSWNSMISSQIAIGEVENARKLFDAMPKKTIISWTLMISGYAKVGNMGSARFLLDRMRFKNLISWNSIIAGYVRNFCYDDALKVFREMLTTGLEPDEITFLAVLPACACLGSVDLGRWVDAYLDKRDFKLTLAIGNALMDMYAKCGDIESAKRVFQRMPEKCVISYTTIVSGFAMNGKSEEALALFETMANKGIEPDDVIFISLLSACSHSGLVDHGCQIFDRMVREFKIKPRIEHYGSMVDLLGRAGLLQEALEFIHKMPMKPNAVIWATLLASSKIHGSQNLADIATKNIRELEPDNSGYQVLVSNVYAATGLWDDVRSLRTRMREMQMAKTPGCSLIEVNNSVHEFLSGDRTQFQFEDIYSNLEWIE